jgi:hypothetical protein
MLSGNSARPIAGRLPQIPAKRVTPVDWMIDKALAGSFRTPKSDVIDVKL